MMYVVNGMPVYFPFCLFGGALPSENSYFYTVKFIILSSTASGFLFLAERSSPSLSD